MPKKKITEDTVDVLWSSIPTLPSTKVPSGMACETYRRVMSEGCKAQKRRNRTELLTDRTLDAAMARLIAQWREEKNRRAVVADLVRLIIQRYDDEHPRSTIEQLERLAELGVVSVLASDHFDMCNYDAVFVDLLPRSNEPRFDLELFIEIEHIFEPAQPEMPTKPKRAKK